MYRLPNQFTRQARLTQSAAGGGSTSTTCSCCVITAVGASILTAVHFSGLNKAQPEFSPPVAETVVEPAGTYDTPPPAGKLPDFPRNSSGNAGAMGVLGFFSLLIAAMVGGVFSGIGGPFLGGMVAIGAYVAIFGIAYDNAGLPSGKGMGVGILAIIGMALCAVAEVFLWFGIGR